MNELVYRNISVYVCINQYMNELVYRNISVYVCINHCITQILLYVHLVNVYIMQLVCTRWFVLVF